MQLRPPRFRLDDFSLPWKDFGQQDALDFFIAIKTAIGQDGQLIILISRFPQG
jgi:hypothetical protein